MTIASVIVENAKIIAILILLYPIHCKAGFGNTFAVDLQSEVIAIDTRIVFHANRDTDGILGSRSIGHIFSIPA